jgi:hypothetical protein
MRRGENCGNQGKTGETREKQGKQGETRGDRGTRRETRGKEGKRGKGDYGVDIGVRGVEVAVGVETA